MFGAPRPGSAGGWAAPAPEELQRSFPDKEIRGILGHGGMGAVYKAFQTSLQRFVAIKILPPGVDDGGMNFAERFKQEARAMAKFKHPGIVGVYDAGETPEGMLYFVMEYVEGTDIAQFVAEHGKLAPAQALRITSRVCEALTYAHEHGVIHRDIKPSNVMIEPDGTVKVADFGLAKLSSAGSDVNTMSSLSIGTSDFMPPEALQGSRHVDQRGDIYATGGLLYQMLTGKAPHGRFEPASVVVPGLDKRLDAIIEKAMHADPAKRYARPGEFLADLARIAPTLKSPATGRVPRQAEPPRRSWKKGIAWALAAVVLLGIGAVAFDAMKKGRTGRNGDQKPVGTKPKETASGAEPKTVAIRRSWKPAPAKFNAVIDRDAVHLQRFNTWSGPESPKTNVAVRSLIVWQPSPPGRNELIKVTARSTDNEHYYACLYGSMVELGYYRAQNKNMLPLQRWPVDPPPGPDEAISLQLACVGERLAVWVRGRLVGTYDDDTVTGSGKIGVQAVDGHVRNLEFLDLDGLTEAAAFQRLGLDASGTSAVPSREWVSAFPDLAKLPGIAEFRDGWARLAKENQIKQLSDADGTILTVRNGGIRARRLVPENWHGGTLLHIRTTEGGRRLNLCYFEPKEPGEKAFLQLREFRPEALPANPTAEEAWAMQKLLAEERIPPVSGETVTELVAVGGTVRGLFGAHRITAGMEDAGNGGRMALDEAGTLSFRDVEVLNLDSLPEAQARVAAGMQASTGQAAKALPVLTAASTNDAEVTPAGAPRWRDALAESPMKEIIAKAPHTARGYLLPDNNHWTVSPKAQRSGAVRVRAAGVNAQYISLYALLDDRQSERIRYRDLSKQWKLSLGELGVNEADVASTTGATPLDGQPHELVFARVGGRLRAMLDGQVLFDEADRSPLAGRFVVDVYRRASVWVETVEYLELDGVPEAEALKLIGMDDSRKGPPAATTGGQRDVISGRRAK